MRCFWGGWTAPLPLDKNSIHIILKNMNLWWELSVQRKRTLCTWSWHERKNRAEENERNSRDAEEPHHHDDSNYILIDSFQQFEKCTRVRSFSVQRLISLRSNVCRTWYVHTLQPLNFHFRFCQEERFPFVAHTYADVCVWIWRFGGRVHVMPSQAKPSRAKPSQGETTVRVVYIETSVRSLVW